MIKKNKKGFSLIELVVTIAIMATLSAILVPSFLSLNQESREKKDKVKFESICTAIKSAVAEPEVRKEIEDIFSETQDCTFTIVFDCNPDTGYIKFADGIVSNKPDNEHKFLETKLGKEALLQMDREYKVEAKSNWGNRLQLIVVPKTSNTTTKITYTWEVQPDEST